MLQNCENKLVLLIWSHEFIALFKWSNDLLVAVKIELEVYMPTKKQESYRSDKAKCSFLSSEYFEEEDKGVQGMGLE